MSFSITEKSTERTEEYELDLYDLTDGRVMISVSNYSINDSDDVDRSAYIVITKQKAMILAMAIQEMVGE